MNWLGNPPYKQEVAGSSPALPTKNLPTFQPHSGNLIEELIDTVDRHLLPHLPCDAEEFYMGDAFACPNKAFREVGGQGFCERHAKIAEAEL